VISIHDSDLAMKTTQMESILLYLLSYGLKRVEVKTSAIA